MGAGRDDIKHTNNLKRFRKASGKSQAQVAAYMGVSVKSVSAWETGRVELKADHIVRLARYLGCTPNDILGFEATPQAMKVRAYEEKNYMEMYSRLAPNVREALHTILDATSKTRRPR